MKIRDFLVCSLWGVLGAFVCILLFVAALWLYDQPAGVRNVVVAIIAGLAAISAAALFGAEYIKNRRSK